MDSIANIRAGRSIIGGFPLDDAEQEEKEHERKSALSFAMHVEFQLMHHVLL